MFADRLPVSGLVFAAGSAASALLAGIAALATLVSQRKGPRRREAWPARDRRADLGRRRRWSGSRRSDHAVERRRGAAVRLPGLGGDGRPAADLLLPMDPLADDDALRARVIRNGRVYYQPLMIVVPHWTPSASDPAEGIASIKRPPMPFSVSVPYVLVKRPSAYLTQTSRPRMCDLTFG